MYGFYSGNDGKDFKMRLGTHYGIDGKGNFFFCGKACFSEWYEAADMPGKDEDGWYDMEYGFSFKSYMQERRRKAFGEAMRYKETVEEEEKNGLQPLSGSPAQISYAAKIRNEFVRIHGTDATDVKRIKRAKTWIEKHKDILAQ